MWRLSAGLPLGLLGRGGRSGAGRWRGCVFADFDVEFFADTGGCGVGGGEFDDVSAECVEGASDGFGLGQCWGYAVDFVIDSFALL